ncbi:hypothetical protein FA95DRAFT_814853 [Auriscalpium vulgare]|uniref:Uncharacterized protein n=1 Tax=Auriscalpium vulgare TaxID=40419 RepID=A0ACB8R9K3_9AGAM|nr:hypothetical protein FA95DRAFT_814853 [Auriscalpium vulgare]
MPETQSPRPTLPASSLDFALPSSSPNTPSPALPLADDFNPLLFRFRRPSLLAPKALSESRLASPLTMSFPRSPLRPSSASESDRERMWADSSPSSSSDNVTPPLQGDKDVGADSDSNMKTSRPRTPPRKPSSASSSGDVTAEAYMPHLRRLSFPVRMTSRSGPERFTVSRFSVTSVIIAEIMASKDCGLVCPRRTETYLWTP